MINNKDLIEHKVNLLLGRMKGDKVYHVILPKDFSDKHNGTLAKSANINRNNVMQFKNDINLLNNMIVVWWMYVCNSIWEQIEDNKKR